MPKKAISRPATRGGSLLQGGIHNNGGREGADGASQGCAAKGEPGEKLALVLWEKQGEVCCMVLMRTQALSEPVREVLGPLLEDLLEPKEVPNSDRKKTRRGYG